MHFVYGVDDINYMRIKLFKVQVFVCLRMSYKKNSGDLKKEVTELKKECDILKKALIIFSKKDQ